MKRRITILIAVFGLLLTACQSSIDTPNPPTELPPEPTKTATKAEPTPTDSPAPTDTPVPTATLPPSPTVTQPPPTQTPNPTATLTPLPEGVEAVSLKTEDGMELAGFLYTPENPIEEPIAVLLAHEYYSSHESLEILAEQLTEAGFTTLALDYRGHGASPGTKGFTGVDVDTKAAINELLQRDFEQIICIGASMGASGCMAAAAEMEELIGFVNLSGPMKLAGKRMVNRQDLEAMSIPKIFMLGEQDQAGPEFVEDYIEMTEWAAEPKEFYLYPVYAHAAGLLLGESGEEVQAIILDFVISFSPSAQQRTE